MYEDKEGCYGQCDNNQVDWYYCYDTDCTVCIAKYKEDLKKAREKALKGVGHAGN